MKLTDRVKNILIDGIFFLFGGTVYALSVDFFTSPNNIAPGGVTGIATMLNFLFRTPIGTTALILNIPLFLWGAYENGVRFLTKTAFATVMTSVMIDVVALAPYSYTGDTFLAALFGGLIGGAGLALIFYRGGTTGGTDIIARNLHRRFPHITMGSIILICDAVVILLSALVYGSIESALYAVVAIFVNTKVIDAMTYGFSRDNGKLMLIITSFPDELSKELLTRLRRGVTVMRGRGAYSHAEKGVLILALRPTQVHRAKSIITALDSSAFMIVTTATAVYGEGFKAGEPEAERERGFEKGVKKAY